MLYNGFDDRQLHVWRIGYHDARFPIARHELYRVVVVHREREHSLLANHLYAVLLCALVAHEAPRAAARQSVLEVEARTYRVLRLVQMRTIRAVAMSTCDDAEYLLQQVELMRREVVEVARARNVGL